MIPGRLSSCAFILSKQNNPQSNPKCVLQTLCAHFTSQKRPMTLGYWGPCECAHRVEEPQSTLKQLPLGALLELWPSRTMQLPAVNVFFQPSIIQGVVFNGRKDKLRALCWSNLITATALSLTVYPSFSQWENKPCCSFLCHDFEVYCYNLEWVANLFLLHHKKGKGISIVDKSISSLGLRVELKDELCIYMAFLHCIQHRDIGTCTNRVSDRLEAI